MGRILAAAVVLGALALTGCSSSGPSADDKKYADAVAAADPDDFGAIPTDELADTLKGEGPDLCKQLNASYDDAVAYAKTGFSTREAEALVAGAALVYCPDQKNQLP
jgi:hypothetical protein